MAEHDDDDDEVGYRKPPKHSRFRPGESGNPRGRPKGSHGLKTDLHAELASTLTIQINGKPYKGTKQQLILKALATRASAGDVKAAAILLPLILQVFGIEDRGSEKGRLSKQDQLLLEQLLADDTAEAPRPPTSEPEAQPNFPPPAGPGERSRTKVKSKTKTKESKDDQG